MELIFYKGKGKLLDKAIRLWTWGPYSHVEIRFEEHLSFSSSWRDGGVRFRDLPINVDHWDRLKVNTTTEITERMLWWCAQRRGVKYDLVGIFGFFSLFGSSIEDAAKWYCSEICAAALTRFDVSEFKRKISPSKLYQEAVNRPSIFTPVKGPFEPLLPKPYLEPARELARDILAMDDQTRARTMHNMMFDDKIMYAIVKAKINEIKGLI